MHMYIYIYINKCLALTCMDEHWPAMTRSELATLLPIACTDCSRPSQRCSCTGKLLLQQCGLLCPMQSFAFFSHCNGHLNLEIQLENEHAEHEKS